MAAMPHRGQGAIPALHMFRAAVRLISPGDNGLALSIRGSDNYSFHRVQFVGLLFVLPVVLGRYVVFPGNVGDDGALLRAVEILAG
ncbi:MAG: hypothetical protein OXI34_12700 [Chloroflexota bacterium]|nr:hypothetical protein [Chloroflexota bacterium]MDE2948556.1 hypothetical protein [Chloroflexota bacterium]